MKALALVEHADRELDLLCLVRTLLMRNEGIDLQVANVSADAPPLLRGPIPKIVFFSSFYSSQWPLRRDYVSAWPGARMVSLAWEQIFCPIDERMHRPLDDFARLNVRYLAWSADYRDYLIAHGVEASNIDIVGHSLYRLYEPPYSRYFGAREMMAERYRLDATKRWVFVPENYGFLFLTDAAMDGFASGDVPRQDLMDVRSYCQACMCSLGRWADALARRGDVEVVFRPRPAVDADDLRRFLRDECGLSEPAFGLIKEQTAREWVLASDVVVSSYSTVLIEAAVAGKTIRKIEPKPLPPPLRYDWCDLVTSVTTQEELFEVASPGADDGGSGRLRSWAKERFFSVGDPVSQLVRTMAREIKAAHAGCTPARKGPYVQKMPAWLGIIDPLLKPRARDALYKRYVPGYTHKVKGHEKDFFDAREVIRRTRRWDVVTVGEVV